MTDAQPVKDTQKLVWSLGDYRELARQFEPAAVALVEACGVGPGMEVLEVAAGTGNLAVAAARRGARVVASDLTPRMVELGRARSAAEGLDIEWREADCNVSMHKAAIVMWYGARASCCWLISSGSSAHSAAMFRRACGTSAMACFVLNFTAR